VFLLRRVEVRVHTARRAPRPRRVAAHDPRADDDRLRAAHRGRPACAPRRRAGGRRRRPDRRRRQGRRACERCRNRSARRALPGAARDRHRADGRVRRHARRRRLRRRHVRLHARDDGGRPLPALRRGDDRVAHRRAGAHVRVHEGRLPFAADRRRAVRVGVAGADAPDGRALGGAAMLDVLHQLGGGFAGLLQVGNFVALLVGLVVGMLVAVLPGLTLVMGVVLALPFTYGMPITPSIILLTAMYISGTYGGAITSILFRIPGEPMDVPLLWDGWSMAHNGEPARALGWTLLAALTGGLITATVMVTLAVPFAKVALTFDSPEYFAIVMFGFTSVVTLGGGSVANAFISLFFGMLISTVGVDEIYGVDRFTF